MRTCLVLLLLFLPTQAKAQSVEYATDVPLLPSPTISLGSYSAMGFGVDPTAQLIDYLSNKTIRKRLEFSDEQNEKFQAIQKEYGKGFTDLYAQYPELKRKDLPREARAALNRKVVLAGQKLRKEFSEKVKETLIPQQVNLLTSIRFKQKVQMYGFAYALSNAPVADQLGVSKEQIKKLARIKQEADAELRKKMEEIKAESKSKMLKVLDAKQRKMLKEIEGKETDNPK